MSRKKPVLALVLWLLLLTGCAANTSSNISSGQISSTDISSVESSAVSASTSNAIASSESVSSKSSEPIYATNGEVTLGGKTYAVEVVQTEVIAPDTEKYPLCAAVGKFDLVVRDGNGKELHRQNLNQLYDNKMIGYWGVGPKDTDKMNFLTNQEKTQCVFGVIVGHGQDGACIMFSMDVTGEIKVLPVEGGYVHADSMSNHMGYGEGDTIYHFKKEVNYGEYVWNGSMFVFKKVNSSPAKIVEGQNSLVASNDVSVGSKQFTVEVMQTKYLKPDITKTNCRAYGNFEVIVKDTGGDEVSRIGLNQFFKNEPIGLDVFQLRFGYNAAGTECLFGVRGPGGLLDGSWMCNYVLLKLDESGTVTHVPVQDDYVFSMDYGSLMMKTSDKLEQFTIDFMDGVYYVYTWNGEKYTHEKKSQ